MKTWSAGETPTAHLLKILILSSRSWVSALRVRVAIITGVLAGRWELSSRVQVVLREDCIGTYQKVGRAPPWARGWVTAWGYAH